MSGDFRGIERLEEQKSKRAIDSNLQIQNQPSLEPQKTEGAGNFREIYQHFIGQQSNPTEVTSPYVTINQTNDGDRVRLELEDFKNQIGEFRKEFESVLKDFSDLKETKE